MVARKRVILTIMMWIVYSKARLPGHRKIEQNRQCLKILRVIMAYRFIAAKLSITSGAFLLNWKGDTPANSLKERIKWLWSAYSLPKATSDSFSYFSLRSWLNEAWNCEIRENIFGGSPTICLNL